MDRRCDFCQRNGHNKACPECAILNVEADRDEALAVLRDWVAGFDLPPREYGPIRDDCLHRARKLLEMREKWRGK